MKKYVFMALVAFAAFGMSSCQPNEPETSVVVNPKTMQIAAGAQDKVRASLNPSKEGVTFVYKSSDESIATVNQSGVVTGVTPGKANIIVSAEGAKSDTCAVTVVDPLDIFAWGGMGLFGIGEEPLGDVYEYTSEYSGTTYKLRNYVGTWYLWSSDVLFVDGEGFSGAGYMVALEAPVAIIQEGASKGAYLQTDLTFDNLAPKDSMGVAEEGALTDAAEWGKFVTDSTYEGDGSFKGSNINYYNFDDNSDNLPFVGFIKNGWIGDYSNGLFYQMNITWFDLNEGLYGLKMQPVEDSWEFVKPFEFTNFIEKYYEQMPERTSEIGKPMPLMKINNPEQVRMLGKMKPTTELHMAR